MKNETNSRGLPPKAVCVHDLAGYGRCSLSVILPTLAAMGVQPCAVPTAVFSTHTGGYENYTFLDFTPYIGDYYRHWLTLGTSFDAFYSGFLGSAEQIGLVCDMMDAFDTKTVLVDPVMGDDGVLYSTYDDVMRDGMKELVKKATVITPNVTEALFLLDTPYKDQSRATVCELEEIAKRLAALGPSEVVITGINTDHSVKTCCYSAKHGRFDIIENERVPKSYPGTGDIFASVLLGGLLRGEDTGTACRRACGFVHDVIEYSDKFDYPAREGVLLEPLLYKLTGEENKNERKSANEKRKR